MTISSSTRCPSLPALSSTVSQRAASTTSGAETSYTGAQSGSVSRQSSFGQTESSGSSGSTGYTGAQVIDPFFQGNPLSVKRQALADQLANKAVSVEQRERHPALSTE
ncbi:hypothetical protein HNY73_006997 [Argiope bruennichi]|uniref:Uncharacterized protein n=1 Tax=Argiope bruennichi TaxID=94029 RepID=A0A8T0FF16_ARGBR|nr:hypothetical protein HNY73_006997 [Argiope bruennichi]